MKVLFGVDMVAILGYGASVEDGWFQDNDGFV
jgi:hypothetical protein